MWDGNDMATRRVRAWVSGSVACLTLLGSAVGLAAEASAAPAAVALAGRPSIPVLPPTVLDRVFCASAKSCWAVGSADVQIGGPTFNQVLRWNGRGWSRVSTPNPGGTGIGGGISEVAGIGCASPAMCWAVGSFSGPSGSVLNQVLRWNGRTWSVAATPDPGGTVSELDGVSCPSATSCWAVGDYHTGRTTLNQVLHWNGRKWSLATAPSLATASGDTNRLTDIRCTSPSSCWAVGDSARGSAELNQILHWNGRRWSQTAAPDPGGTRSGETSALSGVSCTSPLGCWAVGHYGSSGRAARTLNQVLRWNGRRWTLATSPEPGGTRAGADSTLSDVACTSSANCWAAGSYVASVRTGAVLNQALRWNGRTWSLVKTPNPAGTGSGDSDFLYGIGCASSRKCWAVGLTAQAGEYRLSQLLRWNGTRWAVAGVPS
jgi:hypothetical protein